MVSDLLRSPLHDRHVDAGARFGEFGGWEMPLEYPGEGGGTVAEHQAVREAVGIFDVSHLGKASVAGPGAARFVNSVPHQRPGPHRARLGAVHAVLRPNPVAWSTTSSRTSLVTTTSSWCPMQPTPRCVGRLLAAAAPAGVEVRDQHATTGLSPFRGRVGRLLEDLGPAVGARLHGARARARGRASR